MIYRLHLSSLGQSTGLLRRSPPTFFNHFVSKRPGSSTWIQVVTDGGGPKGGPKDKRNRGYWRE
jgi:hypothetical protein